MGGPSTDTAQMHSRYLALTSIEAIAGDAPRIPIKRPEMSHGGKTELALCFSGFWLFGDM